jgi:hypothetical protein
MSELQIMPSETLNFEVRIKTLNTVLTDKDDRKLLYAELQSANGDMSTAMASLKGKLPDVALQKVALAHSLAMWSDDHVSVVKALSGQADITNLRDVALHFNVEKLTALVDPNTVPVNTVGATADEKKNFPIDLHNKLFTAEPTVMLHRLVQDAEVPIADANHRTGVASFLSNQPEFNIRTTSVYTALKHPDAFKGIAEEHRAGVGRAVEDATAHAGDQSYSGSHPRLVQNELDFGFLRHRVAGIHFLSATVGP